MQPASSLKYMPQLDALRAFAVLAVMVHHFLPVDRYLPTDYLTLGLVAVRPTRPLDEAPPRAARPGRREPAPLYAS